MVPGFRRLPRARSSRSNASSARPARRFPEARAQHLPGARAHRSRAARDPPCARSACRAPRPARAGTPRRRPASTAPAPARLPNRRRGQAERRRHSRSTYSLAIVSRSAARAMASRRVRVGSSRTSWASALPEAARARRAGSRRRPPARRRPQGREHARQRARAAAPPSRRGAGQRGEQQHDAEVRVGRRRARRVASHRRAAPSRRRPPRRPGRTPARSRRRSAGSPRSACRRSRGPGETLPGFGALTSSRHAAWARTRDLVGRQAPAHRRRLTSGFHVLDDGGGDVHRRSSPASPRQPGMPLTSRTNDVAVVVGSRSTPAYSAPTARAAAAGSSRPRPRGARPLSARPPRARLVRQPSARCARPRRRRARRRRRRARRGPRGEGPAGRSRRRAPARGP